MLVLSSDSHASFRFSRFRSVTPVAGFVAARQQAATIGSVMVPSLRIVWYSGIRHVTELPLRVLTVRDSSARTVSLSHTLCGEAPYIHADAPA